MSMEYLVLNHGDVRLELVPSRGGMVTGLSVDGDDVLFLDEATLLDATKSVRGGIPVLFPFAGRLADDRLLGRFPMKQHGFARELPWRVHAADATSVTLSLSASDATLAVYPWRFELRFRYTLEARGLLVQADVTNQGDEPMPIHPGLHPYFRVDAATKADVRVQTSATRAWDNRAHAMREYPAGALSRPFDGEVDLHVLDHGASGTRLDRPGLPSVDLTWSDDSPQRSAHQTVLVLWTLPGSAFVCVEPWMTSDNAVNEGRACLVAPGQTHRSWLRIALA